MGKIVWFLLPLVLFAACADKKPQPRNIFCDAELVQGKKFVTNGVEFVGGENQSNEEAFEGTYSLKITKGFGFTYKVEDWKVGEFYKASVWIKGDGFLVLSSDELYVKQRFASETRDDGWKKLEINIVIPPWNNSAIGVYCWNNKEKEAYFDNLKVERTSYSSSETPFKIMLNDNAIDFIVENRDEIMRHGKIEKRNKPYFSAFTTSDRVETQMKFKGHWGDHVVTNKISWRLKAEQNLFNGLNVFNIQHPGVRNYVHEWLLHQLLKEHNILTTDYHFSNVEVNNVDLGVYAFEEHFSKSMVANKHRRGVMLKKDEDVFFGNLYNTEIQDSSFLYIRNQKTKIISEHNCDDSIKVLAHRSVENYLEGKTDGVNIEKFARFLAISDLLRSFHSTRWHNQRWFFDAETKLLEPVVYDGFVENGFFTPFSPLSFLQRVAEKEEINNPHKDVYLLELLQNEPFKNAYLEAITELTDKENLDNFFIKVEPALDKYCERILVEYPHAKFDKEEIYERALELRKVLELNASP